MDEPKVVVVNQRAEGTPEQISELQLEITNMKLTSNLLRQINFSSVSNKFEYFEELLRKKYACFSEKIAVAVTAQKQIAREAKALQKEIKEIRVPQVNYARLAHQVGEVQRVSTQIDTHFKISKAMLKAIDKIEAEIDDKLRVKRNKGIQDILI